MTNPIVSLIDLGNDIQKTMTVFFILIDGFPVIPPIGDVINSPRIFYS